jgi:hypothetical protein
MLLQLLSTGMQCHSPDYVLSHICMRACVRMCGCVCVAVLTCIKIVIDVFFSVFSELAEDEAAKHDVSISVGFFRILMITVVSLLIGAFFAFLSALVRAPDLHLHLCIHYVYKCSPSLNCVSSPLSLSVELSLSLP